MDTFKIRCPGCRQKYRVPIDVAGRPIDCPKCQHHFTVPAPTPEDDIQTSAEPAPEPAPERRGSTMVYRPGQGSSPNRRAVVSTSRPTGPDPATASMGDDDRRRSTGTVRRSSSAPAANPNSNSSIAILVAIAAFLLLILIVFLILPTGAKAGPLRDDTPETAPETPANDRPEPPQPAPTTDSRRSPPAPTAIDQPHATCRRHQRDDAQATATKHPAAPARRRSDHAGGGSPYPLRLH